SGHGVAGADGGYSRFARVSQAGGRSVDAPGAEHCLGARAPKEPGMSELQTSASQTRTLHLTVNGKAVSGEAEPRLLLSDFLRHELGLTGTHVGCEHGVCGCCTVLYNGEPIRSCLMLAVQANGADIMTVEGLAGDDGSLHPIQQ